jgi:phosphoglycerate dehydrogenase-like enzyme
MTNPITVLVPDRLGEKMLSQVAGITVVRYDVDREPDDEQQAAEVVVLGLPAVDAAARFHHGLPNLCLVQTLNAGFDQWIGRLPDGVSLSNARGAHGRACAEWVAAVLLAHARELHSFVASQQRESWDQRLVGSLEGARVAVLGAGDLGTCVQAVLEPFGCEVTLVARTARSGVRAMDAFLPTRGEFDIIVVVLPLTDDTRRIIDAEFLAGMGDAAVLVNAGRGPLVDNDAIIAATAGGRIHALLDVTDPEPLPAGHPLWSAANVTITPHVSGATPGIWERAWRVAAAQIEAYVAGERPPNQVQLS